MDVATWHRMMEAVTEQALSAAPYKLVKKGDKWAVVNNAGETKATFDSRAKALRYQRALYVNVPGAARKADKTKWTGKAPAPKG